MYVCVYVDTVTHMYISEYMFFCPCMIVAVALSNLYKMYLKINISSQFSCVYKFRWVSLCIYKLCDSCTSSRH
jgi:hypothetical protein